MNREEPVAGVLPHDEVNSALHALNDIFDGEDDLELLLRQVCSQVARAVPGVDEVSITLLRDGHPHTAVSTDQRAIELDHDQYRLGNGPCLEAGNSGELVRVAVGESAERWPEFVFAARRAGFASFLAAPLSVSEHLAGAVNCYGIQDDGYAELDARLLEIYTTAVEAILRIYARYLDARTTIGQLRTALTSRAVIDQAKGVLMAVRRVDEDEAFSLLVVQSQRENVKLRQVAERFIDGVTGRGDPGRAERGSR
ncbi:GAF and ANTAR domain-containing protein [Amycolatopsis oliviviridis]|uniref:Transcriptional regulator n=1 Tax=Amycolatopsis oliviviridis TaxID=1471590 RepID=A0ABQ3M274_9PSEU|nr:GAF and ANTAR domain-containing protein [Amycolatopsis oliviviridis]GHH31788.1 transcriptional regulator [Amycolatopsis oliviviridis]